LNSEILYLLFKTTCLEGDKRLAADDPATGYQNGLDCKCAEWTAGVPQGECVDNKQEYIKTCDKDTVEFADPAKNECDGPAVEVGECGEFAFSEWGEWLYCSENCGEGVTTRTRTCTALGDVACPAAGSCDQPATCLYEEEPCQIQKCLTCANYENYCDNQVNTDCKDVTLENGETTV